MFFTDPLFYSLGVPPVALRSSPWSVTSFSIISKAYYSVVSAEYHCTGYGLWWGYRLVLLALFTFFILWHTLLLTMLCDVSTQSVTVQLIICHQSSWHYFSACQHFSTSLPPPAIYWHYIFTIRSMCQLHFWKIVHLI